MKAPIETKTADAILQRPVEIKAGDYTYSVAPPTVATLILVSEAVSRLPHVALDSKKVVEECLAVAKDCKALGEIAAILILGAKEVDTPVVIEEKQPYSACWGLIKRNKIIRQVERRGDVLARKLLERHTPRDLNSIIAQALSRMQVADFFGLTTFLAEINLIRPTKVVTEATASGQ